MSHEGDGHKRPGGKLPYYSPTDEDMRWARDMVSLINEGGMLIYPSTALVYRVYHHKKELVLQNPEAFWDFDAFVTHVRTCDVFAAIGWKVKPGKEEL